MACAVKEAREYNAKRTKPGLELYSRAPFRVLRCLRVQHCIRALLYGASHKMFPETCSSFPSARNSTTTFTENDVMFVETFLKNSNYEFLRQ